CRLQGRVPFIPIDICKRCHLVPDCRALICHVCSLCRVVYTRLHSYVDYPVSASISHVRTRQAPAPHCFVTSVPPCSPVACPPRHAGWPADADRGDGRCLGHTRPAPCRRAGAGRHLENRCLLPAAARGGH